MNATKAKEIQELVISNKQNKNSKKQQKKQIRSSRKSFTNSLRYHWLKLLILLKAMNGKSELYVTGELSNWVSKELKKDGFKICRFGHFGIDPNCTSIEW